MVRQLPHQPSGRATTTCALRRGSSQFTASIWRLVYIGLRPGQTLTDSCIARYFLIGGRKSRCNRRRIAVDDGVIHRIRRSLHTQSRTLYVARATTDKSTKRTSPKAEPMIAHRLMMSRSFRSMTNLSRRVGMGRRAL